MTRDYLLTGDTLVRPLHAIAIEVCEKYGITLERLKGRQRFSQVVMARHEFCFLAYNDRATYYEIGHFLGGRDHSTARHGYYRHLERMGEANG
jgi:chromosomal replication initiator protein